MKLLALLFLFPSPLFAQALEWVPFDSYSSNVETEEALKAEQFQNGLQKSIEGLSSDPFRFEHQMNLALSLQGIGDLEQALKAFEGARKYAKTPEQKFVANYNLGQILGKAKRVDEALAAYQAALDVYPASIETKHNIELLIQASQGEGKGKDKNNEKGKGDQQKDQKDSEGDQDEKDPQQFADNPPPQQKPFQGKEISEADAKKILDELGRQERRIRSEFHKKGRKESPRGKDW